MFYRYKAPLSLARRPRSNVPLVCIESDDWGNPTWQDDSIMRRFNHRFGHEPRSNWDYDIRESDDDLAMLAMTLGTVRDSTGNLPTFTINVIVGEPDYCNPHFINGESYVWRPAHDLSQDRTDWLNDQAVFHVELHGLEHFNPGILLDLIRRKDDRIRWFMDEGIVPPGGILADYPGLGAALLPISDETQLEGCGSCARLLAAVDLFRQQFGTAPLSLVPPNHCWDDNVEQASLDQGIRYIQATQIHYEELGAFQRGEYQSCVPGCSSKRALIYLVRNVDFEPVTTAYNPARVYHRISGFLARHIPVVINTHRLNYVGTGNDTGKRSGLSELEHLLKAIIRDFPKVRFLSSVEMGALYTGQMHEALRLVCGVRVISLLQDLAQATWRPSAFVDIE